MPSSKSTIALQLACGTCSLLYKDVHIRTHVNPWVEIFRAHLAGPAVAGRGIKVNQELAEI